MKKISLSLLLVFLVTMLAVSTVGSAPLYQATATPSPTPNYRTPPPTPTPGFNPVGTLAPPSFECPIGTPSGYGSVEADPSWLASCSHCLPTPTFYPTYGAPIELQLECGVGGLTCHTVDADTIYFTGGQSMTDQAFSQFNIVGDDLDLTNLYVYYRYAGFTVENVVTGEVEEGLQINQGVSDLPPFENYVDYPVDNLPSQYTYTYNDVPRHEHTIVNALSYSADQYIQNFGCTRIYVSLTSVSEFEEFTCPLMTEPEVNCEWENITGADLAFSEYHSEGGQYQDVTTLDCEDYFSAIRCEYMLSTNPPGGQLGVNGIELTWTDTRGAGAQNYYYYFLSTAPDDYWYDHPDVLASNAALFPAGIFSTGYAPAAGAGVVLYEIEGVADQYLQLHMSSPLGEPGEWFGEFIVSPDPIVICDDPEAVPTPMMANGGITGNVCSVVLPLDDTPTLDFDIITTYPGDCIIVPYFAFGDFLDGLFFGLLDLIASDFVTFLNTYGTFPASTICWHYVDFASQYLLNVSVPLNFFAFVMVVVWFARKLSSKGA